MNESTLTSLIIAVGPAVLSYIAGTKKSAISKQDSATSHWQELYREAKLERDEWRSDSESKQQQIDDLKELITDLQREIYTIKESYEDKIDRLEEENIYLLEQVEDLEAENLDLKGAE